MASILDRFKNLVSKSAQKTHIDFNKAIYNYLGDTLVWNPENDDTYIDKGYRYNATIYSIINLITKSATNIPFQVYEVQKSNDLKRYKALTSGEFNSNTVLQAKMLQKKALVELEDTELHELLDRPNPAQSYNSWIQEIIAFGKLTGNRYIYGIGPDTGAGIGKFKELYILPSQKVEINSGGIMEPVKEYTLSYNGTYRIAAEEVCHIKDVNLYYDGTGSHLYGMSPLKAGLRVMDANNQALTTGVKYLQNQTARGILMSDEGDLNEVQAKQLKDKFRQQYQGSDNAGDVIITPKKLSWVNFGLNASDLSLIEQYNATIKDLCNIYNVPVQLLNNTDSTTYNNMKEAKKALYQNAVIPELNKIRDELNRWLAPQYGDKIYIDFDYSAIPELQEEMDKVVGQMSQAWWITPNEKRAAMSYGMDEENEKLNDYYVPANLLPIDGDIIPEPADKGLDIDISKLFKTAVINTVDTYTTIAEAQARAIEMGGSGYHEHLFNGSTVYMPFTTHAEYEAAKNNRIDEFYAEQRREAGNNEPIDYNAIETKEETFKDYPQGATNNARRMLEWREKYGRDEVTAGTPTGWQRASQLANREAISLSTVKRVNSFLARHEDNAKIDPKFKDTPWKDKGYVAYNLWGGAAMVSWAKRISENEG
jgi:HK97 family phage portal protein